MTMPNGAKYVVMAVLVPLLMSCVKRVTIVPIDPEHNVLSNARVQADDRDVGVGVTAVAVRDGATQVSISAGREWLRTSRRLDARSPGRLEVMLRPNQLYLQTVEDTNQIVNRWISVSVDEARRGTWWSTVVAAISGADFEVEIMDAASGFLRTAWRVSDYGPIVGRRRISGNIVTHDPLVWRFRYQVEFRQSGSEEWHEYDRGFADELRVLQEIRGRTEQ